MEAEFTIPTPKIVYAIGVIFIVGKLIKMNLHEHSLQEQMLRHYEEVKDALPFQSQRTVVKI